MTALQSTLILTCCVTIHYVVAMVMWLYARHQVRYLSIAWIMTLFAIMLTITVIFVDPTQVTPGMLNPGMLLGLLVACYLQSIYPLSIPMPGYLQLGRMLRYASPAIILILMYLVAMLLGSHPAIITNIDDLRKHLLSGDILIRLIAVLLSLWYIVNIFRLPHRLTHVEFPRYLIGYSTFLGLSAVYFVVITVMNYQPILLIIYLIIFTILNFYLCMRTLETMALELPKPVITAVEEEPSEEELKKAEEDFNEANNQRFRRVEFWMQHNRDEWKNSTFGRDRLCEQTGLNRHLMLQCVRSQGYNNVHDYINSYRITELKRMIQRGEATTLTECLDAGFGTIKTVRNCFLRQESATLDEYLRRQGEKLGNRQVDKATS